MFASLSGCEWRKTTHATVFQSKKVAQKWTKEHPPHLGEHLVTIATREPLSFPSHEDVSVLFLLCVTEPYALR